MNRLKILWRIFTVFFVPALVIAVLWSPWVFRLDSVDGAIPISHIIAICVVIGAFVEGITIWAMCLLYGISKLIKGEDLFNEPV